MVEMSMSRYEISMRTYVATTDFHWILMGGFNNCVDDTVGGVAVPEGRALWGAVEGSDGGVFAAEGLYGISDEDAGAAVLAEGDGTLGIPAEGHAGGAEDAAFFLEAAAVCQHQACIHV